MRSAESFEFPVAGCEYREELDRIACLEIRIGANGSRATEGWNATRDPAADLWLPPSGAAESLVVVVGGSAWCGFPWTQVGSELQFNQSCDAITRRGAACVVAFYAEGVWPSQHLNLETVMRWTSRLGYRKTGIYAQSSGAGLASYIWARSRDLDLPVDAVAFVSGDFYVYPLLPPTCDNCTLAWTPTSVKESMTYPYSEVCRLDVAAGEGALNCDAVYTQNRKNISTRILPSTYLTADAAPAFFAHGIVDACTECCNSIHLYDHARALGVDVEITLTPNATHIHYWAGDLGEVSFRHDPYPLAFNLTTYPTKLVPQVLDFFQSRAGFRFADDSSPDG